ncbi:hypothetical protein EPO44_18100 [bacterium]|nr:MAG: hypothetical protein EPO44_18100 [bacterium]
MLDVETLLSLGLPNHLISVWQVFLYIAIMVPCLLFQRTKLCLLVTYLFTYYLAFLIYWGDFIASAGSMVPFAIYALSGLAIVVLFVAASFSERAQMKQNQVG